MHVRHRFGGASPPGELLAAAGFRLARIIPTTARVSVIEGEPA